MLRYLLLALLFAILPPAAASAAPPSVIVSIAPQKYLLERIAGDSISVAVLVKPGADPHTYEPSPSQVRAVGQAAAWFTIGVPFEDVWLPRLTESAGSSKKPKVISCIKGIQRLPSGDQDSLPDGSHHESAPGQDKQRHDHSHPHDHDGAHEHARHSGDDPHVWLSPMLVREMLPHITRELGLLLPERKAELRRKAAELSDELEALDAQLADKFSAFPPERRVFITFHPSWGYFAHNYQLTELSIEIGGKEPGPKTLKQVMDAARAHGIKTVFVEPQFPKSSAEAVANGISAKIVIADPLAENLLELYKDMADKLIASFQENS